MKNKGTKEAIFQAFLFNIGLFIILAGVGMYYFYPNYNEINEKKSELGTLLVKYNEMKESGLTYSDFQSISKQEENAKLLSSNIFLSNVLKKFEKTDYEKNFTNTGSELYTDFLSKKIKEVQIQKAKLEESGVNDNIKDILPYYTEDSSLSEDSLTDFKFINYIEQLLNTFRLSSTDPIGMGDLRIVDTFEEKTKANKVVQNPLDGKIYSSGLSLSLVGKKRNIVNFIFFLENVGKINVVDGNVSVISLDKESEYSDKTGDNFADISSYFKKGSNPYNNLVMDIENLSLPEYLDSSDLPTPDGKSLLRLAKGSQGDDKYEVELELRFYVKGLPTYKIEEFIKKVDKRYTQLSSVVKAGRQHIAKNKSSLQSTDAISSINDLQQIDKYLIKIEKDLLGMKKSLIKKENLGAVYKKAMSYNSVFDILSSKLDMNIKEVSEELYTKYKDILTIKN